MPTQGWQSIRSTNFGIRVENAKIHKTFQNNLNNIGPTLMTWDPPGEHIEITNFFMVSNTQFIIPIGYFLLIMPMQVLSPTSAKLQIKITMELAGVPLDEITYSGLTIATDFASSSGAWLFPNPTPGATIETFGERSGAAGNLDVTSGELNFIRLSNEV